MIAGDVDVIDERVAAVGLSPAGRGIASPGFVDLQINGFAGVDFRRADRAGYETATSALAATGATTILPTFYSSTVDEYVASLAVLRAVRDSPPPGTRIGGAHLEGPFLSRAWAGAHDPTRLVMPDLIALHRILGAGPLALMTVAPELAGADEVIRRLRMAGVVVSMGHTDADAETTHVATGLGVAMLTHCWNAHRRFASRDPGPAGVALARMLVGLICDGVHVADDAIRMTFAAAEGRVCVVTDAVAPAGTDADSWNMDGIEVTVHDGEARLDDGTLAGSVATMDSSLRNLIALGIPPRVALDAMSRVPARAVDLGPHDLTPGSDADLVVLDDTWAVLRTLVRGGEVFAARS